MLYARYRVFDLEYTLARKVGVRKVSASFNKNKEKGIGGRESKCSEETEKLLRSMTEAERSLPRLK